MLPQSRNALNGIKTFSILYTFNVIVLSSRDASNHITFLLISPPPRPMSNLVLRIKFRILNAIHILPDLDFVSPTSSLAIYPASCPH